MLDAHDTPGNGLNCTDMEVPESLPEQSPGQTENKFVKIPQFCTDFSPVPHVFSSNSIAARDF